MSETIGDATTGIYGTPNPTNEISETPAQESVPENPLRTTKPGSKRLILTLTVLFSFISGLPFLFKSTEIYRSPLPFESIDSLLKRLDSSPVSLPCGFQVVYIGFDLENFDELMAEKLGFEISERMTKLCGDGPVCGGCDSNFTVSVTVDLGGDCKWGWSADSSCLWQCGAIDFSSVDDNLKDDEKIDGVLDSILRGNGDCGDRNKVYSVVVMNRKELEELRVVVGKYRHAWMVGRIGYRDVVTLISDVFVRWFVKGGKEDGMVQGKGEFMPVGADGSVVLSFSLLNSNPNDWIYDWDFQKIDELLLAPVVEALAPIANISVESQVLYHTPKSSFSYWDEELSSYIFSTGVLPFFVNSNEWHLDTSVTAAGRSKILQFVVYIPSASECPLLLQLPNGDISMTNGFISPMWGGVIVWNPPRCLRESQSKHAARHTFSPQDLQMVFQVFMGQLRQLFGLKSDNLHAAQLDISKFLASERGFTEWELDVLYRHHTCFNLHSCATTLGSLSRLVQSLPRMIVMDEIGKQVKFSLEAASLAQKNASLGIYHASAVSSRQARTLAEDAFFHPSIMSLSYSSIEHYFAIYMPFFAPVLLHIILAALKELRRYKREQAKYSAWCAQTRAA